MLDYLSEFARLLTYYNLIFLLKGFLTTLCLSGAGCILGGLIGGGLAMLRLTSAPLVRPFRWLAIGYTELFRRVPFLVTLMICFFVFQLGGLNAPNLIIACVAVVLIASAYLAEIIRAGLLSVHANQWQSAEAMNFTLLQTIRYIILPQAWRTILPPAFGFFVLFIKDSALASQIGVTELTYVGKALNNRGFSAGVTFGAVLILYFLLSYPLARFGARLEKKLAPTRTR